MKQYPADFRDHLLRKIDAGLARTEAARRYGVAEATIWRWQRRRWATGGTGSKPRPGRPPLIPPAQWAALAAQVREHPDATLAERCNRWAAAQGVRVSRATMARLLTKLDLTSRP